MDNLSWSNRIKDYWKAVYSETGTHGLEEGSWKSTLNNRE